MEMSQAEGDIWHTLICLPALLCKINIRIYSIFCIGGVNQYLASLSRIVLRAFIQRPFLLYFMS